MFDPIFGILLLRADIPNLRDLTGLPDTLISLNLPASASALLYALGHENKVVSDLFGTNGMSEAPEDFFRKWRDQPAATDIATQPLLYIHQNVVMESRIAGCHVTVHCSNAMPCVELSESLLACLEALLATAFVDGAMAREPEMVVKVCLSDFADDPFTFESKEEEGKPWVDIRCRKFNPNKLTADQQSLLKRRLFDVVLHVTSLILFIPEPDKLLAKLFQDDLAPQRALDFTGSFVVIGNVLGDHPKSSLDDWTDSATIRYPLVRERIWDSDDPKPVPTTLASVSPSMPVPTANEPPGTPTDFDRLLLSHDKIRTLSLIRETLWNEALWRGVGFSIDASGTMPPVFALLFNNQAAAEDMFSAWRSELGPTDDANQLRVAIIRKISKANPHWYRVVLGCDHTAFLKQQGVTAVGMLSRIHTLTPPSSANLDGFLAAYNSNNRYILTSARVCSPNSMELGYNRLEKTTLVVRDAWEIGPNDPDIVAVMPNDDPFIPDGLPMPPVLDTLRMKKSRIDS